MALTKSHFYIIGLGVAIMLFVGLLAVGNDLNSKSNINLNNKSVEYISLYDGYIVNANLSSFNEQDKSYEDIGIIQNEPDTGDWVITDFMGTLNYWRNLVSKIENFFKLAYNMPTLFLQTLSLPVGEFNHYLNVVGIILFISIIILLIRLTRGA